ncbi:MAG: serine/threonine protein kinase, partial [Deltaproteobacteria bacterium]|nr:serine/threonine protein kinase [Deltaproteobacteria bacterium]
MPSASRYELLDRIAIGGMAELFRARIVGEQGFYKIVAIKRVLPKYSADKIFAQMLVDEARIVSHLSHPNVVEVYELGRDTEGRLFMALELVQGPSLASLQAKLLSAGSRLPEACALDVIIHLLEALDYAHRMTDPAGRPLNLVHRDVSPDNLLLTREGGVKLTDFGVAKARGRITKTQVGTIRGKLAYMSPEQACGRDVDGRADIFAAGLMLWEALAGRMHYEAPSDHELGQRVAAGRTRPLAEVGVVAAQEIEAALTKALAFHPDARYPRAGDFARDLAIHHRRTYPDYSPSQLGALVEGHFGSRFQLLADRLRRFTSGEERPSGWLRPVEEKESSPATQVARMDDEGFEPLVPAELPTDSSGAALL